MRAQSEAFVGRGWGFPLAADTGGDIEMVDRDREITEAIRLVLATAPGERPMRPEFGCAIHDYVFAPANATTAGMIAFEVQASLERWEPRIQDVTVDVAFDAEDAGLLYVEIGYVIAATNDPRNLVFPFYTIPEEAPE